MFFCRDLSKKFTWGSFPKKREFYAVYKVSFNLVEKEVLGIVGESGSGKSTLAKLLINLIAPTQGEIFYKNKNILKLPAKDKRRLLRSIQIVFQNPYSSLNPRKNVYKTLKETILLSRKESKKNIIEEMKEYLSSVQLKGEYMWKYPHELSGGERQRVAIARALIPNPQILILDEPLSSLDAIVAYQILELFIELKEKFSLSYIFITHDLRLTKRICDKILIMYRGEIIEEGKTNEIFLNPLHPYTKLLLESIPDKEGKFLQKGFDFIAQEGVEENTACCFYQRCLNKKNICNERPNFIKITPSHKVRCFL